MILLRSIGAVAALAAALVAAGCDSSEDPIPNQQATALVADLDVLQEEVTAGICTDADETVQVLFEQAAELPAGDVKKALNTLLRELDGLVDEQCEQDEGTTDTTTTDTTDTTTTDTTDTTDTTTTDTTTTDTTDTTDTTTTDPTTTDTTSGDGGITPGGGG